MVELRSCLRRPSTTAEPSHSALRIKWNYKLCHYHPDDGYGAWIRPSKRIFRHMGGLKNPPRSSTVPCTYRSVFLPPKYLKTLRCYRCKDKGHLAKSCRNAKYCAICKRIGHLTSVCSLHPSSLRRPVSVFLGSRRSYERDLCFRLGLESSKGLFIFFLGRVPFHRPAA